MDAAHIRRIAEYAGHGVAGEVIPEFLRRREPDALYSYDSAGRLTIVKGNDAVCLSPDDLASLRRFVGRVAGLD